MTQLTQCNRCGKTAELIFSNVDIGYWVTPSDWLVFDSGKSHLCPDCTTRAFTPVEKESSNDTN